MAANAMRYPPGDMIHIPAKTPHQALVPAGGEVTYVRVMIPGQ